LQDGTIAEKTALCIKNLEAVLTEAGSSIEKVVKTTVFLSDMASFAVSDLPTWGEGLRDPVVHTDTSY
jgi:enamine deaminase RidA (YjgF/YER057c/UK114 family)